MKTQFMFMTALVAFALFAGCSGRGAYEPRVDTQEKSKVTMIDRSTAKSFKVVSELTPIRLAGGELEAGVVLENTSKKDLWIDWQIVFVDKDGGKLDSTAWTPIPVIRGTRVTLKSNSMNPEAADYLLYVRPKQ